MKKQGGIYLKVVFGVIFVFVALWLLLRSLIPQHQLQTETAVIYEVGDGIATSGFVVRNEIVIPQTNPLITLQRREGEWVGANQIVANAYSSQTMRSRRLRLQSLSTELEQLEYAYTYATANADRATLESNIEQQMVQTAVCIAQHNLYNVSTNTEKLKAYILRRYTGADDSEALLERITALRAEIEALDTSELDGSEVVAPQAGYFSSNVDGLEQAFHPDILENLNASSFHSMLLEEESATKAVGKVIVSDDWYYVTVAETAALSGRDVGDWVTVHFAYQLSRNMPMQIARIGADEGGKSLLILKSDTNVFDSTSVRFQSAEVVFRTYRGLRVPKQALYTDENGNAGVYIIEGAAATWKKIDIICDNGDSYIVTLDKSSTSNLWPGDEIVITTGEIFDQKVVQP